MIRAIWNDTVIAESENTIIVEGNHYFPPGSVHQQYFKSSDTHTLCGWKGKASYYDVEVDGKTNRNAAWYYPKASDAAKRIEGYVAFWHGVRVVP